MVSKVLKSYNLSFSSDKPLCSSCYVGKSHQLSFSSSKSVYKTPLELMYTDIWGPFPTSSINGARYYINFIDAFSKYTWFCLMHSKSQLCSIFSHFQHMAELQLGTKIKCVKWQCFRIYCSFVGLGNLSHVFMPLHSSAEWGC